MKLIFIGSGSAFVCGDNFNSNMLIETDNKERFLIDCGSDARHALYRLGYTYQDITDVYISHLHADHVGGLEWLGFTRKFDPKCDMPNLYICETLHDMIWQNSLAGGMRSIKEESSKLDSYFNVNSITLSDPHFKWDELDFKIIQTEHIYDNGVLMPSFGLYIQYMGHRILITTDTTFNPAGMMDYYQSADIIFHDCETSLMRSTVHSHFEDLRTLDSAIKAKTWLYHYNSGPLPNAIEAGFRGFVVRGQSFDLSDIAKALKNHEDK